MKSWRGSGRRKASLNQPLLPGLFGNLGTTSSRVKKSHPSSPAEAALHLARSRLSLVLLGFSLFFIIASARLTFLAIDNDPHEPSVIQAASGYAPIIARADILDRNGSLLATSLPTVMLMANTRNIIDAKEAAHKLASALPDLDEEKLSHNFARLKRYIVLKRHLTPRQYYAINKMGIAGLEFVPDESRIYPAGNVTAHVLGYTDIDNIGIAGLEKTLNEKLMENPEPVTTTLDIRLQTILHRELQKAIEELEALGGAGLIMDVHTGEILSLVSLPDFDPQKAGKAKDKELFNQATLGVYEMGSTFKIFNTAMALDSGLIHVAEKIDTLRTIEIGGKKIRDLHAFTHWLNLAEIFVESSNIGSARIAEKLGTEKQKSFLQSLGLTKKPHLEIPEIGGPLVPSDPHWGKTATMTISFGHGIAVSALQIVAATAPLINDGYQVQPTLIKTATPPKKGKRLVKKRTSDQMRALMRLAVKYGTAKKAEVPGYLVGGKTGTADKLLGKKYSKTERISSFLGVFPTTAPRYIVFALLDNPKGTAKTYGHATAGWTAAPVVGKIVSQIGPLLNLPPTELDVMEAIERRLTRPLGRQVVDGFKLNSEVNDYASVESNSTH
ncbi:MAG TPA: penicillin-binding protein [Rhodospirillaceae bacterium]|nr:penicillin-binding protein [Rhodospirillaceae bacterium]